MNNLLVFLLSIISFTTFASEAKHTINPSENNIQLLAKKVTLKAGTLVMLETTESLQSRDMTIGQLIQFKVKTNVYANGKLVIRSGALALGRVKSSHKATYNNPEYFTFEMTSVQAVDGQTIELNPTEQTKKGTYSGQGTAIEKGMMVTGNVMNDYRIKL